MVSKYGIYLLKDLILKVASPLPSTIIQAMLQDTVQIHTFLLVTLTRTLFLVLESEHSGKYLHQEIHPLLLILRVTY